MTGRTEEYERTTGFAEIALGQMKALRHANSPRNYEFGTPTRRAITLR
jgi:hypothetical protein